MRLKKNLSATGNYQLQKALQPNQGSVPQTANGSQGVGETKDDTAIASKGQSRNISVGALKDRFKKNNLTASNPIIGAPLADKSMLSKQMGKYQVNQSTIQFKSKERDAGSATQS
jgi:hypothetical protein